LSLWLTDLVADRSQQIRERRPAEDAAKLQAIIVNETDVFDDHVVNLPFAPLEIKPAIDGKFSPRRPRTRGGK
jgi:hypothetical protein